VWARNKKAPVKKTRGEGKAKRSQKGTERAGGRGCPFSRRALPKRRENNRIEEDGGVCAHGEGFFDERKGTMKSFGKKNVRSSLKQKRGRVGREITHEQKGEKRAYSKRT